MTIWQMFKLLERKEPESFVPREEVGLLDYSNVGLPLTNSTGDFLKEHGLYVMPAENHSSVLFLTERAKEIKVTLSERPHTTYKLKKVKYSTLRYTIYVIAHNCLYICTSSLQELFGRIPTTLYLSIPPTKDIGDSK